MRSFKQLLNISKREPTHVLKNWRTGMWVVASSNRIGVLFSIGDSCLVHLVDRQSGETVEQISCPITELRQAKYGEIPECRRGITKQQAEALGYGT